MIMTINHHTPRLASLSDRGCRLACLVLAGCLMSGCATSKEEMLPAGDHTMLALWNGEDGSGSVSQATAVARQALRRPLNSAEQQTVPDTDDSYARTAASEISQQFPRLPNPDMVMYIFPHLAEGTSPVPGYSTVFSFYGQTQYAMPGERTEAL